jgi:hypothetical protein
VTSGKANYSARAAGRLSGRSCQPSPHPSQSCLSDIRTWYIRVLWDDCAVPMSTARESPAGAADGASRTKPPPATGCQNEKCWTGSHRWPFLPPGRVSLLLHRPPSRRILRNGGDDRTGPKEGTGGVGPPRRSMCRGRRRPRPSVGTRYRSRRLKFRGSTPIRVCRDAGVRRRRATLPVWVARRW